MQVTYGNVCQDHSAAAEVRSLFSARSGAEFGRMAHRERTGLRARVDWIVRRLKLTAEEELAARAELAAAVRKLGGRVSR